MKEQKEANISYWAHHLTTVVSVTFVLMLVGIIAIIWISADKETRRLKEQIELSVIMTDSVPSAVTNQIAETLKKQPYAQNVTVVTKEEALQAWKEDTGEDLMELFGVNPLSEEISFSVKADYASAKSIQQICADLGKQPGVEGVSSPDASMIDAMNDNIEQLTLVLAVIAVVMLVISFVLINNTVHLTIYSRRFNIHTMKLVGATPGFIRRPFILNNIIAGLLAGLFASGIIAIIIETTHETGVPDLADYLGWGAYGIVAAGLVVTGMLLCGLASWISASRYLRKDYDALFH